MYLCDMCTNMTYNTRSVLGNEWADVRRHNVLTPEILRDALMSSVSLIHSLKRDLVNSQVCCCSELR